MFRNSERVCAVIAGGIALLLAMHAAVAQEDLTLPPRLRAEEFRTPTAQSRLSIPEQRDAPMEEILVVRENPWRLPDLGSEWRAREAAERSTERIETQWLPLWDPARQPVHPSLFTMTDESRRVGFIEVFRIRFGNR